MRTYGTIDSPIELEEYVVDPSKASIEYDAETKQKTVWTRIKRLGENFFDKAGDKSFTISHQTKDDVLKKKYFDDDTDNFKLSKGGMFCYSLSDNRFPTAALVFLHLLLSCIIMGCLGAAVEILIGIIRIGHVKFAQLTSNMALSFFLYFGFTCALLFLAVTVVQLIGPNAKGSGIPELKCVFSGIWLPGYFNLKTLVAKCIGLLLARGSGMIIGREGPFVHISSIVSFQLIRRFGIFSKLLKSEFLIRELLTTAVVVGVACSFGSVFGAIVFSIEVTSTSYQTRNYYFSFFSALVTSVVFSFLHNLDQHRPFGTAFFPAEGICDFESHHRVSFSFLVCSCIIGISGALLGALIVHAYRGIVLLRERYPIKLFNPYVYALIVALLTSAGTYYGFVGNVISLQRNSAPAKFFQCTNVTWTNADFFSESIPVNWSLVLMTLLMSALHVLALGLTVPLGVMSPCIAIGSVMGYAIGSLYNTYTQDIYGSVDYIPPCMMAVVGAASLAGAVTHTLSSAFIALEMTAEYSLLIPCTLATLISVTLAKVMADSIFTLILKLRKLPFLPNFGITTNNLILKQAMHTDFPTIVPSSNYKFLKEIVHFDRLNLGVDSTQTLLYPILNDSGICLGCVTASDIVQVLAQERFDSDGIEINYYAELQKLMTYGVSFSSKLELYKLHSCFSTLSLQQIFVEEDGKYCGVLTRNMLVDVIEDIAEQKQKSAMHYLSNALAFTSFQEERQEKRVQKKEARERQNLLEKIDTEPEKEIEVEKASEATPEEELEKKTPPPDSLLGQHYRTHNMSMSWSFRPKFADSNPNIVVKKRGVPEKKDDKSDKI